LIHTNDLEKIDDSVNEFVVIAHISVEELIRRWSRLEEAVGLLDEAIEFHRETVLL
jgi:hypothetical protein